MFFAEGQENTRCPCIAPTQSGRPHWRHPHSFRPFTFITVDIITLFLAYIWGRKICFFLSTISVSPSRNFCLLLKFSTHTYANCIHACVNGVCICFGGYCSRCSRLRRVVASLSSYDSYVNFLNAVNFLLNTWDVNSNFHLTWRYIRKNVFCASLIGKFPTKT